MKELSGWFSEILFGMAQFRTFSLSSRPGGGVLAMLVVAAVIMLPIVVVVAVLALVFFAVRLILRGILSLVPFSAKPPPRPFADEDGRRNVRVRQVENLSSTTET